MTFLYKQIFVEQEKFERRLGLEPRSPGVQPSAFTIRPPALVASHCCLALT